MIPCLVGKTPDTEAIAAALKLVVFPISHVRMPLINESDIRYSNASPPSHHC